MQCLQVCAGIGLNMIRAATVGTHPAFVSMIRELIDERLDAAAPRHALGTRGASHDVCPADCCLPGATRPVAFSPPNTRAAGNQAFTDERGAAS